MKFEEDHLTIRLAMVVERQEMEIVLDADYSITKESVVFGVVTGSDVSVPAGARVPARAAENEEEFVDQPFSFRFRVDRGALTVKDLRIPGLNKEGDAGLSQMLTGRFAMGHDEPPAGLPQTPGKSRSPSVVPRRVLPPATRPSKSDSSYDPQLYAPVPAPSGAPVGPVTPGYPH